MAASGADGKGGGGPPCCRQCLQDLELPHGQGWPVAGTATPHDNVRMSKDTSTKLSSNGLRYTSKEGGSPFLGSGATRSCLLCGKHRRPDQLQAKRMFGRTEMVCKPNCASVT